MQTHPCYPLTDANRAEYERLNEAKSKLATTTDINERITLMAAIGAASQAIRRIGLSKVNQGVPLPKKNDADELARLRADNDQQQAQIKAQAETILQQRISLDQAHKHNIELRKALDALGFHTNIWFPLSSAMAAALLANKQPVDAADQTWAQQKAQELGYTEALQDMSRDMVP